MIFEDFRIFKDFWIFEDAVMLKMLQFGKTKMVPFYGLSCLVWTVGTHMSEKNNFGPSR